MPATHHAFEKLYAEHYAFVWHSLRRLGVPTLAIDDAVQDTFVTAFRRQDTFDGRSPRAWLYCIGRRVANNTNRARTRRERRHANAPTPVPVQSPSEGQIGAQRALAGFLNTLEDRDRELFVLSEIDGLTGPELVAALGRKLPTLYGRIRVLRARLRTFAGDDFDPAEVHRIPPARPRSAGWIALQPWLHVAASPAPAGVLGGLLAAASTPWVSASIVATVVGGAAVWSTQASDPSPRPAATPATSAPMQKAPKAAPAVAPTNATAPPLPSAATPPPRVATAPSTAPSPRAQARARNASPRSQPSAPTTEVSPLAEETRRLREVQSLLRAGDPQAALERLATLEQRFPRSVQSDLRAVLEIEALCALDRVDPARKAADALRTKTPDSPMMRRLADTCAGQTPISKP